MNHEIVNSLGSFESLLNDSVRTFRYLLVVLELPVSNYVIYLMYCVPEVWGR